MSPGSGRPATRFATRGQPAALAAVERMLERGVPQVLLLVGPGSVGKTTLALDLAAGLLCAAEEGIPRPCRACRACHLVAGGTHQDLHRLAPEGSGRQVRIGDPSDPEPGTVRHLIHEMARLPVEGRHRVAIIEGAHRMNEDAQNALLKTLEEPPPGATLILCADEPDRLLPTVRSRAATLRLGPLGIRAIEALLGEHGVDPPRAARLARAAGGRPGLALAYAAAPQAVDAREEIARTLLDLISESRARRLAVGRELLARAADVARTGVDPWVSGDRPAEPEPAAPQPADVVAEVAKAAHEAGLKFGIYVSPWDRHEKSYGDSAVYNEHMKNQLRELLTGYGEIAEVWFDGACGEGPNGKRQEYDWDGYYGVIRELMPKAAIAICGPDVRWCGNEAGSTRASEWSVIPSTVDAQAQDVGSREVLAEAAKRGAWLTWHPSEVDTSIRPGWFYHTSEDDKVRSLHDLLNIYFGSVGGNAQLLLNIPPDRRGRIADNDVQRLAEIGDYLHSAFATNLAAGAKATATNVRGHDAKYGADKTVDGDGETYWASDAGVTEAAITYEFAAPKTFNMAVVQEQIRTGQRIEEFALYAWADGDWKEIARATTVGHKRILRFPEVTTEKVRLRISQSRVSATVASFGLYKAPPMP